MNPLLNGAADLHGHRPADDDELLLRDVHRRVTSLIDDADDLDSLAVYAIRSNGAGYMRWVGHQPPPTQHDACKKLVRKLRRLNRVTAMRWLVCAAGWLPGVEGVSEGRYDQVFMVPKDPRGCLPFVVDTQDTDAELVMLTDGYVQDCFSAWIHYAKQLHECGIRKADMVDRVANLDRFRDPILFEPEPPPPLAPPPRRAPARSISFPTRAAARRPSSFSAPASDIAGRSAGGNLATPPAIPRHGT